MMNDRRSPDRVIWITTDHMRHDCIGANGNSSIYTPNLDALVAGAVSFDRCYCQNPLCMPSRASFMTGLYPQQTGVTHNGYCLRPDFDPVAARCFSRAGYISTQIGKLHLQPHEDNDLDPRARYDYGFDKLWLAEEPGAYDDAYMKWLNTDHPDLVELFRVPRPLHPGRGTSERPRQIDALWTASYSGWVAEQAKRHLQGFGAGLGEVRNFMHLGFYAPHPPLNPTVDMMAPYRDRELVRPRFDQEGEFRDKPDVIRRIKERFADWSESDFLDYRRHFYAMVTGVDFAVGELVEFLRKRGELENTLIIFCSDHGDMCGDHGMTNKHETFYDEIMNVPLFFHWPAGLGETPRRISGLVELVDVLPTALGLCGIPVPPVMCGTDWSGAIRSGGPVKGKDSVLAYQSPGHVMLRTDSCKYIRYSGGEEVLFDLQKDSSETVNCSGDPAYSDLLNAVRYQALSRMAFSGNSPQPRNYNF